MSPGASAGSERSRAHLSIGEALGELRGQFPDITISKIRFLEAEGLVEPERSPAGYRKFTRDDVERLRYVLVCQRERYLPLRVIREQLESGNHTATPGEGADAPARDGGGGPLPTARDFGPQPSEVRLSRAELARAAGMTPEQLAELERFGLIAPVPGGPSYDGDALVIARTVAELAQFGVGPRHVRAFKTAADREVGLIEQVAAPIAHHRGVDARARAQAAVRQLAALSVRLHAALVRAGLPPELRS